MLNRIAGNANTASKSYLRYPDNYPSYISKGEGAYIYDEAGNKYLDFVCSLGPIILGHRFPQVDEAVIKTIKDTGTIFSLPHKMENELANLLAEMIPCAEMTRLTHNGKDATEAAIRLARGLTEREIILTFSYHGAADVFMTITGTHKGTPECLKLTIVDFNYNDCERVAELMSKYDVAAIILEPHTIKPPKKGFLQFLREITLEKHSLLIFDEVVSFPRYPGFSASKFFEVEPDLMCISKGMANGYPISALVGKKRYMEELRDHGIFVSTTFGGNLIGVSAAIATLKFIRDNNVPQRLEELGNCLKIDNRNKSKVALQGYPWRRFFKCKEDKRQKLQQDLIQKGYFLGVPIFFNYSMTKEALQEFSIELNKTIANLDNITVAGRHITEVFKKV
jgi:glutamate-1-semialdehyde 2,1-aminomutase